MRPWLMSRRTVLLGAGRSLISLPLLEAMFGSERALAQGAVMPRFAFFFFPNGTVGTEMSPRSMDTWKPVLSPFASLANELLFVNGLHNRQNASWKWYAPALGSGAGHEPGAAVFLTCNRLADKGGTRVSISIDQLIGQHLQKKHGTRLSSLVIGDGRSRTGIGQGGINVLYHSLMSWKSDLANAYAAPLTRPSQVFSEIFSSNPARPGEVDPALAKLQARRQSILDTVKGQEAPMRARLGTADRARLDQFFTSLREVESKLGRAVPVAGTTAVASCGRPAAPADVTSSQFVQFTRTMLDLVVLGLQCQVTPSVCYQLSRANNGVQNGTFAGVSDDQHGISHHGGNAAKMDGLRKINTWYNGQVAYYLEQLKKTQELGGPLLRNVVTLYGSELSDANGHNAFDLPVMIAGGQNLGVETGGIVDVGLGKAGGGSIETDHQRAAPLANLHLSLAKLAGVTQNSFGNSTGTIALAPMV